MNKKEVLEIKKQFTPANCSITRLCGCYVDAEKEKRLTIKESFLSLPEEETFKYFEIFKKSLSGSIGKNLFNMEFPLEEEAHGGKQTFLLQLRDSKLKDDALLDKFYDNVIEYFSFAEHYYVILIHCVYDVPGKALDGSTMFDASDEVYEFLLCSICPVSLSKPGLSYDSKKNSIEERIRDWIVEMPVKGFLFPAFDDRSSDIHKVLYYTKKSGDLQPGFIDGILGTNLPVSSEDQKKAFNELLKTTFETTCKYKTISGIHEDLHEMIETQKEKAEPLKLSKSDLRKVFENNGVSDDELLAFDKNFDSVMDSSQVLYAENITNEKKLEIKHPSLSIKVDPERLDLIETKIINKRKCLVITVDDSMEVNGVPVNTL